MPQRGAVDVTLHRVQAATAACWLMDEYKPPLPADREHADALGKQLEKALQRKRDGDELHLQIPRDLVQWFACFTRGGGRWWHFGPVLPADRKHATEIARELDKVWARARELGRPLESEETLCELKQVFATFPPSPADSQTDVMLPGQDAPQDIRDIAKLFLKAASGHKGRPRLDSEGAEAQLQRAKRVADDDGRSARRLEAKKRDLEWMRRETDAAGPEPEA